MARKEQGEKGVVAEEAIENQGGPQFKLEADTDEIAEYYRLDPEEVNRYEDARRWYFWLDGKAFGTLAIGYLLAISVGVALSFTDVAVELRNLVMAVVFVGAVVLAAGVVIIKYIVKNRLRKESLNPEETVYYELSQAIENRRDGKSADVMSNVENARKLMVNGNTSPFDAEFNDELVEYLDTVAEDSNEHLLEETFPEFEARISRYLSLIKQNSSEEIHYEVTPVQDEYSTPVGMVKSFISDMAEKRIVRVVFPVVLGLPIIVPIYFIVSETAAQYTFLGYIAILQIYHNLKSQD